MTVSDRPRLQAAGRPADASRGRPASYREDLITAVAGTWLILALFSDGWAHLNVPELEGFFTPWHAALYSGFLAAAAWIAGLALRRGATVRGALRDPLRAARRLPTGYGLGALGVLVFGVGGVLDLLWHTAFGVEEGLDALLSPSHLVLFTGGMLLISAPLRGAWAAADSTADSHVDAGFRRRFPELLSLTLTTGLAAFFLLYVSAFVRPAVQEPFRRLPEGAPGHAAAELPAVAAMGGYLLTTVMLVVPLLLLARRGRLPGGSITLLVGSVAWLSVALTEFQHAEVAVSATFAAAVVDVLAVRLDRRRGVSAAGRLPALGALLPAVLWPAQVVALAVVDGLRYPVALWSGIAVLSVLLGAVLGVLAATPGSGRIRPDGAAVGGSLTP